MKVLIAPNEFKGTIEADRATKLIDDGLRSSMPEVASILCPIADGGDGTCQLLAKHLKLNKLTFPVLNPIGKPVLGAIFLKKDQDVAYLDISTASGLKQLRPYEREVTVASSYGTGQLIRHAEALGVNHIILGLGGSASVDMGTGILQALGYQFLDEKGRAIPQFSPGFLSRIAHIQSPIEKSRLNFTCLCDVNNHFFGAEGAVPVFGPQKGLLPQDIPAYKAVTKDLFGLLQRKSKRGLQDQAGFGAAGGIALGLNAFFPVEIKPGAQFFFEQVELEDKIREVDVVITGEGRYDAQSAGGKGPFEVLQLAKKYQKKTIIITSGEGGRDSDFDQVIRLPDLEEGLDNSQKVAESNLYQAVKAFFSATYLT